jgi:mycothiol synthase
MVQIRNYQHGDIPALIEVRKAMAQAGLLTVVKTVEQLETIFGAPGIDPTNNVFVVEDAGRVVGYVDSELNPATGSNWSDCAVHPDYAGQGIGTDLIRRMDAHTLRRVQAECSPDLPVSVFRFTPEENQAAVRLFEAEGYQHVRNSYRMRIDFDAPVDVPPLPEGITIRPVDVERDGYTVFEVQQEAFMDMWAFERATWEEWKHFLIDGADTDLSLWLTAYEGDEMVGVCICRPYGELDPDMAYVRMLGVRRPWRKRGVGMALLKRAFALFQAKGYKRAALGVDATSLTNAVALYERAGMHIWKRSMTYRKMLRGEAVE